MRFATCCALMAALLGGLALPTHVLAQAPSLVAPTNALTPEGERKKLIVPDGFEVQLVASEPDIQKPMQMAFDAKGRIWVTTSYHYPFPAPRGKSTDKLFILSDFDSKGKARKVQTFAADLNIPIGILPLPDCNSCIVSSVGEILKLTDTNGDGKADKREVLFSGFGSVDTHGTYNSYTLMPDGWVYACHGFRNDSHVKGKDGHEVHMNSGNTFRFRPDGSRIEIYTHGQVNPFGMCVDPWFNFYTADCHSRPITQLIPGAYYESFGKPHGGLGFGPVMFGYDPGGTGMCGVAWYDADHFPDKYKGCMFLGNVVTSRVNFCKIEWTGATPKAVQQPDFIKSDDPWFRPVYIKLGPDGAIYINDFYNKIIGHYEVDLRHPKRDKDHGRIWRVVWKGKQPKAPRSDWTKATVDELTNDLTHPNITVRFLAGNQLLHRARTGKNPKLDDAIAMKLLTDPNTASGVAGWWAFVEEANGNKPSYDMIVKTSKNRQFKPNQLTTLVLRAMASHKTWGNVERATALDILNSFDAPQLKRATTDAMGMHPHADFVLPLLAQLETIPAGDATLRHATRIALRNCLSQEGAWKLTRKLPGKDRQLIGVALAIRNRDAAEFLANALVKGSLPGAQARRAAVHLGRYGDSKLWDAVAAQAAQEKNSPQAFDMVHSLVQGMQLNRNRGDSVLSKPEPLITRIGSELQQGPRESRLAALRLLPDLPTAISANGRAGLNQVLSPILERLVGERRQPDEVRAATLDAMKRLNSPSGLTAAGKILQAKDSSPFLRERCAILLASSGDRGQKQAARDVIQLAPYRSCVAIATVLAANTAGGEILLDAVKQGKAPARLLQEKAILDRLHASRIANLDKRIADLTKGLQPADKKLAGLIKLRTARYASAKADKELGAKLFQKHCGACHKIGEQGGKIAPNLDGIGVRGLERLLEDILDPNRNVDAAFRARVLNLTDGTTKAGLMLRVEGETVVMADEQGKEYRVPMKDIEKNRETALSPMPANFGEAIPEADLFHLVSYLLAQRGKDLPKK